MASGLADGAGRETRAALLIPSRRALALALGDAPAHRVQAAIRDAREALAAATDPQIRLGAGAALLQCRDWLEPADAAAIEADLAQLAAPAAIAPAIRAWWSLQAALCRIDLAGEPEAALGLLEPALALAANSGLDSAAFSLESAQFDALLAGGDPASARKALARLRALPGAASRAGRLTLAMADARLLLEGGDSQAATRRVAETLPEKDGVSGEEEDVTDPDGAFHRMAAALHAQAGDAAGAAARYAMAERMARGHGLRRVRLEQRLAAAYCASRTERRAQAADALRDALAEHRAEGSLALFPRHPQLASALSAFALREKIEVPHVRGIVRRQRLAPPDCLIPEWPWPIAVRTLGKLEIWLDGDLVKASGKAPQRPLMLLKALLCGGESGKSQAALADQLWPEAESAKSAVNVTIHRLRKLLGSDAAIVVASGTVALNRKLVWTDISDLCKVCNRVENLPVETAAAEVLRLVNALLDLYRGPFCEGEESSWLIAARDRWRNHFLAAVAALGKRLETYGAWTDAIRLYLHALDNEPLAEAIHRGLMRCAHARNDSAAAYSAYRRCRDTLSIVLGRKPSPETEKLAIALGLL
ncbi:MAG: BTAD domain-containing putative transcriptional regulator [Noviherbaspirillum sp.]